MLLGLSNMNKNLSQKKEEKVNHRLVLLERVKKNLIRF